ncbi:DNA-directed RNA polymerases I, II, and III subunit RPABC2-like isoform X1 [Clavelina lepadiformis]|uniref:DNA-directed RNA polymerases I, II, and III subunit RPABC2-like isoform X1 n=1 Tax=Clavelina lepadiformis TaxID=159417 RepID=UPI004042EF7E
MSDHEDDYEGFQDDAGDMDDMEGINELENEEDGHRVEILDSGEAGPIAASKRITTPYLTKYERARVLGTRALQISAIKD